MNKKLISPFPYFGGKGAIASTVWQLLGDVRHYIEPFFGSGAVLLQRPDYDATRHVELVNDADGHICNLWRSLQFAPDETARWCDWPVNHADLMARKKELNLNTEDLLRKLSDVISIYEMEFDESSEFQKKFFETVLNKSLKILN